MIVVTTNDLPGWKVDAVLGEVFGLTVRARNIGAQFGAGFKAMFGGELKGITQQLQQTRDEAMTRMVGAAQMQGQPLMVSEEDQRFAAQQQAAQQTPPKPHS